LFDVQIQQDSYTGGAEGTSRPIRVNPRGEQIVVPNIEALVHDGCVFGFNLGTGDTEFPFVEVAYDDDQPQIGIAIPAGTTVLPLSFEIAIEAQVGTLNQFVLACGQCAALGSGTSTAVTPVNILTRGGRATTCTVFNTVTVDITADPASETGYYEFWRHVDPYAHSDNDSGYGSTVGWHRAKEGYGPIVVGPGFIVAYIYATTTDAEGFLRMTWAEIPSTNMT